jgi:hypothetical protein
MRIFPATIIGSIGFSALILITSTVTGYSLIDDAQFSASDIRTIWQVHAAITSIAFVVAVFLVEFSTDQLEDVTRSFILRSGAIPLLYFIASTSFVLVARMGNG